MQATEPGTHVPSAAEAAVPGMASGTRAESLSGDMDMWFDQDTLDRDQIRRALLAAATDLGTHLRAAGQLARTVELQVTYADGSTTRSRTLREPTAHTPAIRQSGTRCTPPSRPSACNGPGSGPSPPGPETSPPPLAPLPNSPSTGPPRATARWNPSSSALPDASAPAR